MKTVRTLLSETIRDAQEGVESWRVFGAASLLALAASIVNVLMQ